MNTKNLWSVAAIGLVVGLSFALLGFVEGWTKSREKRRAIGRGPAEQAVHLNEIGPRAIDADTRFDEASATGGGVSVRLELAGGPVSADELRRRACSDPAIRDVVAAGTACRVEARVRSGTQPAVDVRSCP